MYAQTFIPPVYPEFINPPATAPSAKAVARTPHVSAYSYENLIYKSSGFPDEDNNLYIWTWAAINAGSNATGLSIPYNASSSFSSPSPNLRGKDLYLARNPSSAAPILMGNDVASSDILDLSITDAKGSIIGNVRGNLFELNKFIYKTMFDSRSGIYNLAIVDPSSYTLKVLKFVKL